MGELSGLLFSWQLLHLTLSIAALDSGGTPCFLSIRASSSTGRCPVLTWIFRAAFISFSLSFAGNFMKASVSSLVATKLISSLVFSSATMVAYSLSVCQFRK